MLTLLTGSIALIVALPLGIFLLPYNFMPLVVIEGTDVVRGGSLPAMVVFNDHKQIKHFYVQQHSDFECVYVNLKDEKMKIHTKTGLFKIS